MNTLKILKVFFRLKHQELKKAYFYFWFSAFKSCLILKVFFRLKHQELKKAYFYFWFSAFISCLIITAFYYKQDWYRSIEYAEHGDVYWYCCGIFFTVVAELILFAIGVAIWKFFKWIRSNWQKAKEIVNKDKQMAEN